MPKSRSVYVFRGTPYLNGEDCSSLFDLIYVNCAVWMTGRGAKDALRLFREIGECLEYTFWYTENENNVMLPPIQITSPDEIDWSDAPLPVGS